ncbi:MAG: D-alanyl-D-alanine carboxypeptidase [Alphaproteobacteria bacterium]|nr:D-alanyl-D-alanine carboxypeptidase [Alphaproteobacteria bacterium]
MPLRTLGLSILAALALVMSPVYAAASPTLLFDFENRKVLYAEDADRLWYPASLTKIMTAYVAFEAIKQGKLTLESKLVSSETAAKAPPSKIGLPIGAEISLELGLRSLIIKSANDIAIMIAEGVAGSEQAFIERMNATAQRLGMARTHFVNPNGLPVEGQVTTARDLAKLTMAVLNDFPEHAHYWATPYVRIGKARLRSHNSLLRTFDGADGVKTGFICDSGFNIVASATRAGRKLVAIVLGSASAKDRGIRAENLLDHGFLTLGWKQLLASQTLDSLPVSTKSSEIVSIRDEVTGWSCGNRTAARRRARLRRARLLSNKLNRVRKGPATAQATVPPTKAPVLPAVKN